MADILRMIALNPLPSETLGDFPSRRWDQLRRDVADFLKSPRAAEATRLGWAELGRRLSRHGHQPCRAGGGAAR